MTFLTFCVSVIVLSSTLDRCAEAFQIVRVTASPSWMLRGSLPDLHEFDSILGEGNNKSDNNNDQHQQQQIVIRSRRQLELTSSSQYGEETIVLASSTTLPGPEANTVQEQVEADPYADLLEERDPTVQQYEHEDVGFLQNTKNELNGMDIQDIISTLIVPSIFAGAAMKWGYGRISTWIAKKVDITLDLFASEMMYHDGDFEEMKLCSKDYGKKLVWLGPHKKSIMLKRYLQLYAKKKTVSPQSISSLSYVFSLYNLSEAKAAELLISLCKEMGDNKLSSAGKLLFFGSRIFKDPEAKVALNPIRDMIKESYRGVEIADMMVETSQQAIGEAAYKSAVQAAGKDQDTLTKGWEVLGLDKETAMGIFVKERNKGFITDRERMYGGQSTKYDDKGNRVDKEGKLEDPETSIGCDDDAPTSNVMECMECGHTMFIAKGREMKFFGESFTCPDCGALKDRFRPKDIED